MEGWSKNNVSKNDCTLSWFLWQKKTVSNCWDIILITVDNNSIKCNWNQYDQPLTSHFTVGSTIFPMKRMLWVYWSTINSKNGWSNLTMGGTEWGRKSMLLTAAASVPFSWIFSRALWVAYNKIQQELMYVEDMVWNYSNQHKVNSTIAFHKNCW